jgi:hypothetical protein
VSSTGSNKSKPLENSDKCHSEEEDELTPAVQKLQIVDQEITEIESIQKKADSLFEEVRYKTLPQSFLQISLRS